MSPKVTSQQPTATESEKGAATLAWNFPAPTEGSRGLPSRLDWSPSGTNDGGISDHTTTRPLDHTRYSLAPPRYFCHERRRAGSTFALDRRSHLTSKCPSYRHTTSARRPDHVAAYKAGDEWRPCRSLSLSSPPSSTSSPARHVTNSAIITARGSRPRRRGIKRSVSLWNNPIYTNIRTRFTQIHTGRRRFAWARACPRRRKETK